MLGPNGELIRMVGLFIPVSFSCEIRFATQTGREMMTEKVRDEISMAHLVHKEEVLHPIRHIGHSSHFFFQTVRQKIASLSGEAALNFSRHFSSGSPLAATIVKPNLGIHTPSSPNPLLPHEGLGAIFVHYFSTFTPAPFPKLPALLSSTQSNNGF